MRVLTFTASNGTSITFTGTPLPSGYFITSLEGIDTPTVDSQTQKAPYQDGVTNIDQLLEVRDITLEGYINVPVNLAAINPLRRTLQAVLNPKLGVGNIVYTYDSGTKTIPAKCIACTLANRNMPEPFQKFQIQFECANPYWLSTTTDTTSAGLVIAKTKFPIAFDYTYPLFTALNSGSETWESVASDPSGNIWAVTNNGDIYKCDSGSTTFLAVGAGNKNWQCIASDLSGNIWAGVYGGGIYKCNSGSTSFVLIFSVTKNWVSITSDPHGNIWAAASSDDIYKCNVNSTNFIGLGTGILTWLCITSDLSGNIWAGSQSSIYKCPYGSTSFSSVSIGSSSWQCIASDLSGNIWSGSSSLGIYKCNSGGTTFFATVAPISNWQCIASDPSGNIWAGVWGGDIYKCDSGSTTFIDTKFGNGLCSSVTSDPSGNIWASILGGNIYECTYSNSKIIYYIFSETSSVSSKTITNNGDVPEPIIATIHGPAVNPTLVNQTTGEFIHLLWTLNAGETAVINTAFGTKTITLTGAGGSSNGMQYLDPLSKFFSINPGSVQLNIYDDTGSAQLRCDIGKTDMFVGI